VPAGNPDGGQWTTIGGGSYRLPSGARVMRVGGEPHLFKLRPGMLDEGDDLPGFEDIQEIPIVRPHDASDRHSIVRRIPMAPFVGKPAGPCLASLKISARQLGCGNTTRISMPIHRARNRYLNCGRVHDQADQV
jgi:hypothetical protein